MATKVLDSWASLRFLRTNRRPTRWKKFWNSAAEKHKLLMSVVNWGEIYYNTRREVSEAAAEQKLKEIGNAR